MKKLRRKIMLSGAIASAVGVALAGAAGITVAAVVKAKKKKAAMETAVCTETEGNVAEEACSELPEEACRAEIDL